MGVGEWEGSTCPTLSIETFQFWSRIKKEKEKRKEKVGTSWEFLEIFLMVWV